MSRVVQALRAIGYLIAAVGAWFNSYFVIIFGFLIIGAAWSSGKILPKGIRRN